MAKNGYPADRINTQEAHSARVYDYILGGKTNYVVDQQAGDAMCQEWPAMPVHMRENRFFMHRAAQYLAREEGVRQFLDIGTGIPTEPNLHEVVQRTAPDSRVVYVDNDPIVLTHAQALLVSTPEGRTAYIDGDMRDPAAILASPEVAETLDLTRPVGLMIIGIVHFLLDEDDAMGIVRRLLDPLPSGSFLAMTIGTADFAPTEVGRVASEYESRGMPMRLRTRAEAEAFFDGLDLVEPGVTQVHYWKPDADTDPNIDDRDIAMYGGVARKN
ncbi:SAM-dependent methyltransferase [Streptomyces sp. 71268]|uniref:SAM-dependent methyltransferase n=1 Tax=Streptomyces sp. 71268 TaxID=3002640 RepID=UPI0023F7735F|nr:SAM-dependent methyltransferase [Streptomyces sp. 71268]WEV25831.1 SAM-dependent methyltransferase [Streptomyces sp. 71268]